MSNAASEALSVIVERELPFPAEKVWRALTQPHLIEEWLMKKYEGVLYKIARERKEDLKMVFACERSFFYNN